MHTPHHLVNKLRTILADPGKHTVGALASAVESSLAELSLLKDRLDLLDIDTSAAASAAPLVPVSKITPGKSGAAKSKR